LALGGQGRGGRSPHRLHFADPPTHPGPIGRQDAREPKSGGEIALGAVPPTYDRDAEVRSQLEQIRNELKFDSATNRIVFTSSVDENSNRDTQLQQEIERFNGLPDALKIVSPGGNSLRSPAT